MLIKGALLAAAVVAIGISGVNAASAETREVCLERNPATGACTKTQVSVGNWSAPTESKPEANAGGASNAGAGARTCEFRGADVPCRTGAGEWSARIAAWCRAAASPPPRTDSVWEGNVDGAIYVCTGPDRALIPDPGLSFFRWLPAAPDAVTRADAEAAARRVLASLGLTAIDLGIHPRGDTVDRMGYVGWHMWLWAESPSDRQWGPVEARATDSGISVSLSARVAEVTWDMGNGEGVTCQRGTAWSESRTQGGRNVASPDCGYVYAEDGRYTVTATSDWAVEWSAAGYTGTLPLTLSRSADVIVGELQSVAVGG